MIQIHKDRIEQLIQSHQIEINKINKESYTKLQQLKDKNYLGNKERKFIRKILYFFKNINFVSLDFNSMNQVISDIGEIPVTSKRIFSGKKKKSYLKDEILNVLGYNKYRASFFPIFFNDLGIKSCVYCNAQLTVTIDKGKNDFKANYQLDHYYPKAKYPYLSIALYNLYPVCSTCNLSKLEEEIDFKLYTNNIDYDLFKFELDKSSLIKFLVSRNVNDLIVNFIKKNDSNYNKIFKITEIYNTQKDIIEEIILKSLIYNDSYREYLTNIASVESINNALIDRFILGNYTEPNDVYKRPMSKIMQDIGRQVDLIK